MVCVRFVWGLLGPDPLAKN